MRLSQNLFRFVFNLVTIVIFYQCATSKQFETNLPFKIGACFYQKWIAGIEGGGSGIDVYISIISNPNKIEFDSIYFKGKSAKLEIKPNAMAVARFISDLNTKKDSMMRINPDAEYVNEVHKPILFKGHTLNNKQCVISYIEATKIKYVIIDNLLEKPLLPYPSAPN